MKKLRQFIGICTLCCFIFTGQFAYGQTPGSESAPVQESIEYFEDGSYIITAIEDIDSEFSFFSTSTTKAKAVTYFNNSGQKQWSITVTGTFTYGNGSAVCTASKVSTTVYNNEWSLTGKSASKSGNKATAKATGIHYVQGREVERHTETVTLTCSPTGVFS